MTEGCEATIACGSMVTSLSRGKTLGEVMQITPEDIITGLERLPKDHEHCAKLAVHTMREAVKKSS